MTRILRKLLGLDRASGRFHIPRTTLGVESLEDRACPAVFVGTADGGSTLVITGDNASNHVAVTQNDAANTIQVVVGQKVYNFTSSDISKVKVDMKGGWDTFNWALAKNTSFEHAKAMNILLGDGNDKSLLFFKNSVGSDVFINDDLKITVNAGKGNDAVDAYFAAKPGGVLTYSALFGAGNDRGHANMTGDITNNADVRFNLFGGAGIDDLETWNSLDQNNIAFDSVDVSAGSKFRIGLFGGAGYDSIDAYFGGEIDGRFDLLCRGGDDFDFFDLTLKTGFDSTGYLNAKVYGDAGPDSIYAEFYDTSFGKLHVEAVAVFGGAGIDKCQATSEVDVFGCEKA